MVLVCKTIKALCSLPSFAILGFKASFILVKTTFFLPGRNFRLICEGFLNVIRHFEKNDQEKKLSVFLKIVFSSKLEFCIINNKLIFSNRFCCCFAKRGPRQLLKTCLVRKSLPRFKNIHLFLMKKWSKSLSKNV